MPGFHSPCIYIAAMVLAIAILAFVRWLEDL